ncbi:c8e92ea1-06e3-4dcd-936e-a0202db6f8cd [Thermothielavioides terrestris]|uniref:C8e92ea1-06e3-4dcd-936e-a0202db6f8cd n=1 Tax=Thermothielavioides terrestris TaxID=2587410 RepID=A0A446B877_9PEZI|nr:c8e92ea1-06e3-4dcd-936e-a0202db6f8cd [Thermothielavioides terrestris]
MAKGLVEIRAAQRTFEGAYMRTALSQFSFALVVLRIFTSEFYPIGALLACYGAAVLLVAIYRRYEGNRQFFDCEESEGSSAEEEEEVEAGVGTGAQPSPGFEYEYDCCHGA